MEESGELKVCGDSHLERFAADIKHLIGHAQPSIKGEVPATCWSTNNQDVDIALSVLRAASSSIHDGVTRFNLVFKADPGEAASDSMTKEMEGFCQQMVSSLTLLASVGASKAMVKYCAAAVRAVLHSLKDLANALLDTTRRSQVNSLTGMVWQACKELQQTPKTNKLACRRQMMQWSVAIKDTIEEFQETAKSAAAGNSDGKPDAVAHAVDNAERFGGLETSGESAGDDFDGFDDFGDMDANYSPSELRCVEASVNVLKVFRRCLKAANDALNTLDSSQANRREGEGDEGLEEGEWLKERLGWAHSLQSCLEDANEGAGELGVLLYPPLSASDLSARVDDLERSLSAFCDAFGSPEEGEGKPGSICGSSGTVPLREAVRDKLAALRLELELERL